MSTSTSDSEKFDPSRRRLCPDGSCIGLLDEAGRCKECGTVVSGGKVVAPPPSARDAFVEPEPEPEPESQSAGEGPPAPRASGFDPKRKLCPDGACVGVIGADGRCSVCGQAG
jgi:hypothetical protein